MCTQIFSEGTPFYPFYPLEISLLTESRTHSGSRGYRQDLHLLARLAFSMLVFLGCSFGELSGLLPSQKGGGQEVPKETLALPSLSDSGIIPNVI